MSGLSKLLCVTGVVLLSWGIALGVFQALRSVVLLVARWLA